MKAETFDNLIKKYTEKATHHGVQAILGPKRFKDYNLSQERKYDRLLIEVSQLYLEEYGKS